MLIVQVGPGVKSLSEGDVVIPQLPLMGTWREAAVWQEKQLFKVGKTAAAAAGGGVAADVADVQSTANPKTTGRHCN